MTRVPLGLLLAGTGLLAATAFLAPGGLTPWWVPLGLILVGALPAAWGAFGSRSRWLTGGVLVQGIGVGLTGPFLPSWLAWVGTLGVVLVVGAWTLSHSLNRRVRGRGLLLVAAGVTALAAATMGWVIAEGLAFLAAGGTDARAMLTAWLVLAVATTWGLARWAGWRVTG